MTDPAHYRVVETLRHGQRVEIRALRGDDRAELLAAFGRVGAQSRWRRFFAPKRRLTEAEVAFFMDVDFVNHVALVVASEESGQPLIIGGGRYIVAGPRLAELAFVVVDQFQGQGVGAALLRHLVLIARRAGLERLTAEVLADNAAMLSVFDGSGVPITKRRCSDVVNVVLQLV